MNDIDEDTRPAFSLGDLLALAGDGEFLGELQDDHRDLISELRRRAEIDGKAKGGFVMKVDYALDRRGQVEMVASANIKLPSAPKHKALAYVDGDTVTPHNPRQTKFEFAAAPGRRDLRPIRTIGDAKPTAE